MRSEPRPRRGSYRHVAPPSASGAVRHRPADLAREVTASAEEFEQRRAQARNTGDSGARRVLAQIGEWVGLVIVAVIIAALIRAFLVQAFWIPSGSMENTLQVGDNVLVSRLTPQIWDIKRGDVVVFHDDLDWLSEHKEPTGVVGTVQKALVYVGLRPDSSSQHLIKRVIGVGGDRVTCCDESGLISVNGVPVAEPYLAPDADNSLRPFEVTVPDGRLWVMGDNRNHSADSRAHPEDPFVDTRSVVGRVITVTWPIAHWSNPNNNDAFDGVPPPQ